MIKIYDNEECMALVPYLARILGDIEVATTEVTTLAWAKMRGEDVRTPLVSAKARLRALVDEARELGVAIAVGSWTKAEGAFPGVTNHGVMGTWKVFSDGNREWVALRGYAPAEKAIQKRSETSEENA